ncbi:hypothetical protein ACKI14_02275 [Streptomyces turgidiscabies]|uniref:hypothetical protein n=1 Tax=Streptomyces turgidiscabies TaxID=85558 RepID=UPI0038F7706D
MRARAQFLKAVVESFASGVVAAAGFNGGYWLATGEFPSLVTSLIASQLVTWVWGGQQAYRMNRKWQAVLDAYERPALGEGIDIPNRPPLDDEDGVA